MKRKLFCDISPLCYKISLKKEYFIRDVKDFLSREKIATLHQATKLPVVVKGHCSILVRRLHGVDLRLQENKVTNIRLACEQINGLIINPNEVFSFWQTVEKPTREKGYKEGLIIGRGGFSSDIGGGLCQMANMIHYLILNSPLTTIELHHHTDALFPDERRRVPFGTGTSIFYKNADYRFKNTTLNPVQLITWIDDGELKAELRTTVEFPYRYKLVEENHHYKKEGIEYYRNSQVYKVVIDRATDVEIKRELILNNHSVVMYDYDLIPANEIRL